MPLDKVIASPYDSSQILGIAFRAYLEEATNNNAEVDAYEKAGNAKVLELFPDIYYTQDPNATADTLCMSIPHMTTKTIDMINPDCPVIQWINGGHYQLQSVDSMVEKLPGVQVPHGAAKARVEENQSIISFRSAVGEKREAFFQTEGLYLLRPKHYSYMLLYH